MQFPKGGCPDPGKGILVRSVLLNLLVSVASSQVLAFNQAINHLACQCILGGCNRTLSELLIVLLVFP